MPTPVYIQGVNVEKVITRWRTRTSSILRRAAFGVDARSNISIDDDDINPIDMKDMTASFCPDNKPYYFKTLRHEPRA